MSDPSDIDELEHRLIRERPVPSAAFRGELGRLVAQTRPGNRATARIRLSIAACAGSGTFLMAIAALGILGAGPLAS